MSHGALLRPAALVATGLALFVPGPSTLSAQTHYATYDTRDEWYLDTGAGCKLYVTEFGVGDTVVVLHGGWGAEHSYLLDAFDGLEEDHHLVFYDQRGSLRSPCPDSLVSVDAHVADLERLREALGLERMTLVGHSMGTYLGMAYLHAHPDRVGNLVLLAAVILPTKEEDRALYGEQQRRAKEFFDRPERAAEIAEEGLDRPEEELTDRERTHKWRIGFAAVNLFHVERWREQRGGQVFYDQSAGTAAGRSMDPSVDLVADLAAADFPVTVIMGDHDFADMGLRLYREWLDPLPGVELVEIEDAGHEAWIDAPEAFRAALVAALAKAP